MDQNSKILQIYVDDCRDDFETLSLSRIKRGPSTTTQSYK
jgi:hypothetical protein